MVQLVFLSKQTDLALIYCEKNGYMEIFPSNKMGYKFLMNPLFYKKKTELNKCHMSIMIRIW